MALQRIEGYGQVTGNVEIAGRTDALSEFMRSSAKRLGGIAAKAITKRADRQFSDERSAILAKKTQQLHEGLENLRNRNESNPVRINFKNLFIKNGMDDGSIPGWAANELNKITTLDLNLKLYNDGKRRLTSQNGTVFNDVGMPTTLPPQNVEQGKVETLIQQEAATANAAIKVAPTASQAAEDTIVTGLPKDPNKHKVYALQARRFNNRTVALGQLFSNFSGEELYASITHSGDVETFQEMAFGEVQAHISSVMNEYEGMIIKLADDPAATVNPKDMKHYSRALKKDVLDMYMGNSGAKLALGPKFPGQLEALFDRMDTRTDLIIDKAFDEGTDDTNLANLTNVNKFREAMYTSRINKVVATFRDKEIQILARVGLFNAMRLINPDLLSTGQLDAFKVSVANAIDPMMKLNVETSRLRLKEFSKLHKGEKVSPKAKSALMLQIKFLLSAVAFVASDGDFEGIDADIRAVLAKIRFVDERERDDILRYLDEYKDSAAKAKVAGKPWWDAMAKYLSGD
jgi:ABC-type oligopeptide transport system ATPase subunit